jgi:hypothetical protein
MMIEVVKDHPRIVGMPHSWEEQKLLLSTAGQTERQGTVNYPYVTDPCGLVASHIPFWVGHLT